MRTGRDSRFTPCVAAATFASLIAIACLLGTPRIEAQSLTPNGLKRLTAALDDSVVTRAIATFHANPTIAQRIALQQLGLAVQPLKHVPLAVVHGPVALMRAAVLNGMVKDVYPDERIELFNTASSDAMGAATLRAQGLTGQGVTVAIVDSGCDASHPDLADHVVRNVKLYSGEYVTMRPDGSNTIVVPVDMLPYENSDVGSGHGTHVTGIIGADSTTAADGSRYGVAPDADLVCLSIGEVLFTSAVVTAYDHLLDQPGLWSVDVINNSWGNSFRQFDPGEPVAVVTKAVTDLGVVVVFAAGNSGSTNAEMSQSPYSLAPWVIAVASSTSARVRAESSSNGLQFDNSRAVQIGAGGHTVFTGDRIGIYHPDVTAPGQGISSTCATTGTVIPACPPYGNATASGTSMAAPHVAGAAAILLQANPNLNGLQILQALQATARPVLAADGQQVPFWQAGYGFVDLAKAVSRVRASNWELKLAAGQAAADSRVRAEDGFAIQRSDLWTYDAPRIALQGSDRRDFSAAISATTTHLKVTLSHPSLAVVGANGMNYTVTVRDAGGAVIATTTEAEAGAGTASAIIDLSAVGVTYGAFTFEVSGDLAVSDPDTIDSESLNGRMVTLQVTQLKRG